jgi:hypothetical protein
MRQRLLQLAALSQTAKGKGTGFRYCKETNRPDPETNRLDPETNRADPEGLFLRAVPSLLDLPGTVQVDYGTCVEGGYAWRGG